MTSRVLHVVGSLGRGGAESMVMSLYRAVDRTRVQFDFLVYTSGPDVFDDEVIKMGGRIHRVRSPFAVSGIRRVLQDSGPFVALHAHTNLGSAVPLALAKANRVPIRIAHSHSRSDARTSALGRVYGASARGLLIGAATHLAACGDAAGRNLFGSDSWERRGLFLPNSVDAQQLTGTQPTSLVPELGLPEDARVFACVGRLSPVKNHEFLLELAAHPSFPQDAVIAVIGDGPLRKDLETETTRRGLADRVRFVGPRSDVPGVMKGAEAVLMPSHHEGLPVTLVEAQATGTLSLVSTGVPHEVDLGLGLVRRIPLDAGEWLTAMRQAVPPPPSAEIIEARFRESGYDVRVSARRVVDLYGVDA